MKGRDRMEGESIPRKGLEISELFFEEYGKKMIEEQFSAYRDVLAAGVAGEGSDCFGYDDELSRDHDFEAGFCLWIPARLERELEFKLSRAYEKLPKEYMGIVKEAQSIFGGNRRGVILIEDFYSRFTGREGIPKTMREWLYTPEYSLACAVNGKVFYDGLGEFSKIRAELSAGYPEDVRKKKIAARCVSMAQSGQYNFIRCMRREEYGAASMAMHEFVQSGLSVIFLLNRRYMPYYKWAFRAARELPILREAAEELEKLLLLGRNAARGADCMDQIEKISRQVIGELKNQELSDGAWDYLEPHGLKIMEQIRDSELRNMHVMEG